MFYLNISINWWTICLEICNETLFWKVEKWYQFIVKSLLHGLIFSLARHLVDIVDGYFESCIIHSCFSLFSIFIKMSTVPRKNNQQMQRSHQTHKNNRGVNVQARSLEMEVLSSVCLVPFCHVVSNQTTLTAYLSCQRRTSSPGPNFPRTEEVRTHSVSSVSWQLEVACFPHRRHLKYNNKCVCRVFLLCLMSGLVTWRHHLHIKTNIKRPHESGRGFCFWFIIVPMTVVKEQKVHPIASMLANSRYKKK